MNVPTMVSGAALATASAVALAAQDVAAAAGATITIRNSREK